MAQIKTAGRHEVTVKSAQFGESPDKGTPFIQFGFENAAGEFIAGWLYLSDAAFERAVQTLRDAFNFDGNFNALVNQVVGKKCAITTEMEKFEGKDRLKVKWINRLAAPLKPISDQSALDKFTAKAARIPTNKDPF